MSSLPPDFPPTAPAGALPVLQALDALPVGTRLHEFEIRGVLGVGGFGIVYRAWDEALEREVAIKEYLPASLAGRGKGSQVSLRSASKAETYATGLRSFVNEARLLARFDHPALVKVYRFWEANGTAYMVMPCYHGRTLQDTRRTMGRPPDEAWLRALVEPLPGALEVLHAQSCYHRDIAPDNILLLPEATQPHGPGRPVLLDFGAARRVIADRTHDLTAILKPAFAPIEQYADVAHIQQGPWTDLYALGAVLHYCLCGKPPTPATARVVRDDLKPAVEMGRVLGEAWPGLRYSPALLQAIDAALAVRPQERPQSVAQWRALWEEGASFDLDLAPAPASIAPSVGTASLATPAPAAAAPRRAAVESPAPEAVPVSPASSPARAAPPEPASPREACGRRVLLALWRCLEARCDTPRFAGHPQCRKVREWSEGNRAGSAP